MTRMTEPDCAVMCNLINTHTHTHSSTSSVAILFCFTAGTLIPHASPSLQTGDGAREHPTAPFARPGVSTSASYRGVTGSEGQEGANGVGGGIGVGGGNGDGNGDVNGHGDGDGDGAGAGTGVEVNEGAQDGSGDGNGDGAGTGTGTGVGTRRRTLDGNGTGTGTEARTVAKMGTGTTIITGTRIRLGRAEGRRKSARNRQIVVDVVRETGETRMENEKNVEKKGLVQ